VTLAIILSLIIFSWWSQDSDVPSQALRAQLVALLLPFWLEGLGDRSCRGEGGDLKTSVIKL
jgi:hypothetical protein